MLDIDLMDVLYSSCDWTFAGSEAAGAKLRVRVTPTPATLQRLKERDRQIEEMRRQIKELAEARKAAAIKLELELAAAASSTGEGDDDTRTAGPSTAEGADSVAIAAVPVPLAPAPAPPGTTEPPAAQAGAGAEPSMSKDTTLSTAASDKIKYDFVFSAERCWTSQTLKLFPGDYFVFADVTYNMPYEEAFKMTVPAHLSEAPWLDGKHPANYVNNVKKDSMKSFTRRSSTAMNINTSPAKSKLVIPSGMGLSAEGTGASAASVLDADGQPDLSKMPQMWAQVSSVEAFEIKAITRKDLPFAYNPSVADIAVEADKWPFSSECQADASSSGLMNMLTKVKTEAQVVGVQFMTLANQYKEDRKRMLLARKDDIMLQT